MLYSYTARKGKEAILCKFDNHADMVATMLRHLSAGFKISKE